MIEITIRIHFGVLVILVFIIGSVLVRMLEIISIKEDYARRLGRDRSPDKVVVFEAYLQSALNNLNRVFLSLNNILCLVVSLVVNSMTAMRRVSVKLIGR